MSCYGSPYRACFASTRTKTGPRSCATRDLAFMRGKTATIPANQADAPSREKSLLPDMDSNTDSHMPLADVIMSNHRVP